MITGARCAKRLRVARASPVASGSSSVSRVLHTSSPRPLAFALPVHDVLHSSPATVVDFRNRIEQQKYEELENAIRQDPPSYGRTWSSYVELIGFVGLYNLPREIHQKVLRACSQSPLVNRVEFAKRFMTGGSPFAPHVHEARFKTIIQNMREAGHIPELDDYHYILQQFAAVGYHYGALMVLREIPYVGLHPTSKTYGLCLQAVCHRLALPCGRRYREKLLTEATSICNELTRQMHARNVPFTAATTDLIYRILNKTMSMETLETLLKTAYGIDLSFPDRPPLEFWQANREQDSSSVATTPLSFSTSALNTTIEVLGRLNNVSKLVQAFEVLTTPLPSRTASIPASSFEDYDDDDFGIDSPAVASFPLPYAVPNTFTYESLLRNVSQAGHHVFARHYLLQAVALDRRVTQQLRDDCYRLQRADIRTPSFGVNRKMLLSVFSLANRHKKMELLRWVHYMIRKVLRLKRADIRYYTSVQQRWYADNTRSFVGIPVDGASASVSTPLSSQKTIPPVNPTSENFQQRPAKVPKMPYFDVDLEAHVPPSEPPRKRFSLDFHLALLQRDVEKLKVFERHAEDVVARNTQRVKERLGRRIWGKKAIYMRFSNRRERIHPTVWLGKVNFRTERAVEHGVGEPKTSEDIRNKRRHRRTSQTLSDENFFTSSFHHDMRR